MLASTSARNLRDLGDEPYVEGRSPWALASVGGGPSRGRGEVHSARRKTDPIDRAVFISDNIVCNFIFDHRKQPDITEDELKFIPTLFWIIFLLWVVFFILGKDSKYDTIKKILGWILISMYLLVVVIILFSLKLDDIRSKREKDDKIFNFKNIILVIIWPLYALTLIFYKLIPFDILSSGLTYS